MTDLMAARCTMAISLGFHIILASIGMVMPFLMAIAHRRWLKTGCDEDYRLTRAWARGVAIFFATGAVSGTALSFELGILWPGFMVHAGPIIGMPFSLEGAAFFLEAIALGIYLYGWGRIGPRLHWWVGLAVGVFGISSGVLVVAANGWMNSPTGFVWENGVAHSVDPIAAMLNPAWFSEAMHMVVGSFEAVGFAVAGVHAALILRGRTHPMHLRALKISLVVGAIAALVQPMTGHYAAQDVAERQPLKLAAMESHFETGAYAPIIIGGIPNEETGEVDYALEIPGVLSVLAFNEPSAVVKGLNDFPRDEWPPIVVVHFAFQIMVGLGTILALLGGFALCAMRFRPRWLEHRRMLMALVAAAPMGFIAIEAGWVVTEVGRQPWIIYEVLRTADAVTPVPGQVIHLVGFTLLYLLIGCSTVWMWSRQVRSTERDEGPPAELRAWALGDAP